MLPLENFSSLIPHEIFKTYILLTPFKMKMYNGFFLPIDILIMTCTVFTIKNIIGLVVGQKVLLMLM
jgi:hypothetical protein